AAQAAKRKLLGLGSRPVPYGPVSPPPVAPSVQSGKVLEDHDVFVPSDETFRVGKRPPVYRFRLNNTLPANTLVIGFDILKAALEAVRGTGAAQSMNLVAAAQLGSALLSHETKIDPVEFAAMLSVDGKLYTGVATGAEALVLPNGTMRVRARYVE